MCVLYLIRDLNILKNKGRYIIMKKSFEMENLDCANCAAKMEQKISKIEGVNSVSVNFFAQKIVLDADDGMFDDILKQAKQAVKSVDADCEILG